MAKPNSSGGQSGTDPTDADLDIVEDEARQAGGLGPRPRSPQQGIADMQARIAQLTDEKRKLLAQNRPDLLPTVNEVTRQINEARDRLREYQAQAAGQN